MEFIAFVVAMLIVVRVVVRVVEVKVIFDMDDCLTVGFKGKKEAVAVGMDTGDWTTHDEGLKEEKVNWKTWFVYMVCMLCGMYMVVLSARGDNNKGTTVAFMKKYWLTWDEMVLRTVEYEGVRSAEYKKMMVDKYGWDKVLFTIDDDEKNITAFNEVGCGVFGVVVKKAML